MTSVASTPEKPIRIGRVRVENFVAAEQPDLEDPAVREQLFENALEEVRNERRSKSFWGRVLGD